LKNESEKSLSAEQNGKPTFTFVGTLRPGGRKKKTILPHDATELNFLLMLFNYHCSVVTGRVNVSPIDVAICKHREFRYIPSPNNLFSYQNNSTQGRYAVVFSVREQSPVALDC
jgi:hypothetical protein